MMLPALSEGIGSNWAGFGGLGGAKQIIGTPDNLDVLCIIPFGYPARPVGKGKKERKPLGEVVSRNRYGQPFACPPFAAKTAKMVPGCSRSIARRQTPSRRRSS